MSNDGASDVCCSPIVIDLFDCLVSCYTAGPAGEPNAHTRSHLKLYRQASMPSVPTMPDLVSAGTVPANDKQRLHHINTTCLKHKADATGEMGWDLVDWAESLVRLKLAFGPILPKQ